MAQSPSEVGEGPIRTGETSAAATAAAPTTDDIRSQINDRPNHTLWIDGGADHSARIDAFQANA